MVEAWRTLDLWCLTKTYIGEIFPFNIENPHCFLDSQVPVWGYLSYLNESIPNLGNFSDMDAVYLNI